MGSEDPERLVQELESTAPSKSEPEVVVLGSYEFFTRVEEPIFT